MCAIKVFKGCLLGTSADKKDILYEAGIIGKIRNEHVINIYKIAEMEDIMYLVFPFLSSDLHEYISNATYVYNSTKSKRIMSMILSGLRSMHHVGITHRDIKPANILVDVKDNDIINLKICDLGLASEEKLMKEECGTTIYMAPEMFLNKGYNVKVDIWVSVIFLKSDLKTNGVYNYVLFFQATGCILAELIKKNNLIGYSRGNQLDEIFKVFGTPKRFEW